MKKIFLATLIFLTSFSVFSQNLGNYSHRLGSTVIKTPMMTNKDQAISTGYNIVNTLENADNNELNKKLSIGMHLYNSVKLKDTTMTVREIYGKAGVLNYQAVIDVTYQYTVRDTK